MSKLIEKHSPSNLDNAMSDSDKGTATVVGISVGAGLILSGVVSPPVAMMGGVALMLGSLTLADIILMSKEATKTLSGKAKAVESPSLFCSEDGMKTHLSKEEVEEFLATEGQSKTVSQCSCQLQ